MELVGFVFVKEKRGKYTLKNDLVIEQPKNHSFKKKILRWEHVDNLFKGYSTHSENPLFISLHENNSFRDPLCLLCISIISFL